MASLAERTALQLEQARAALGAVLVDVHAADLDTGRMVDRLVDAVGTAQRGGVVRAVGWRLLPEDRPDPARAAEVVGAMAEAAHLSVGRLPCQGVFASGGDMATGLLRRFGALGFAVEFAVQPLVVTGRLTGGTLDGLPFATKGGLIGDPDAITESVLHLQCMPASAASPATDHAAWRSPPRGSALSPGPEVVR